VLRLGKNGRYVRVSTRPRAHDEALLYASSFARSHYPLIIDRHDAPQWLDEENAQ
jgi:hypothetical protein